MPINSFDDYPLSWKPQRPAKGNPLYLSIARQLEQDILDGPLLPGTKLPPQRELADYLDVNISTIVRAFRLCSQKGLLNATVGKGTYVSYDAGTNLNILQKKKEAAHIELGPLMPSEIDYGNIISAIQGMMSKEEMARLLGYGDPEAAVWQREAAIRLITQAGFDNAVANRLLLANGSQNAIAAVLCGLFKDGDRIGTDFLTYTGFKSTAKMLGIHFVPIEQKNGEMSEAGVIYACRNEKIKGIYVMPDYHNPTTHVMSDDCRRMLARMAVQEDLILIEDKIHGLFCKNTAKPIASYAPEQTVYIASLSKTLLPGLRLAYIVSPHRYETSLDEALYNLNLSVSPFLFELASRLMASDEAERIAEAHQAETIRRNRLVDEILQGYQVFGAEDCMFRWMHLPQKFTSEAFEEAALQAGVQVFGAHHFAVGSAKPYPAVRLSITTPKTMEDLRAALYILRDILQGV